MKKTLLLINSSGRHEDSVTRQMAQQVIEEIDNSTESINLIERDIANGIPFVDDAWIDANFTPEENRNQLQMNKLSYSDNLVDEIQQADYLVIGSPIYNFSIPAVLKAWVDQIARARLTFKYTEKGPVGLMTGKKAFLVMASGGVPIESGLDFATPYLKQALRFIGIEDVTVIDSNQIKEETQLIELINESMTQTGANHA